MAIKNKRALSVRSGFESKTDDALSILEEGIVAANPFQKVLDAKLPNLKDFKRIFVVGFGKAAPIMAEAIEYRLGEKITEGIIIGLRKAKTSKIKSYIGTHPSPSKRNQIISKKIMCIAKKAKKDDLLLVLISGGGSSMLSLPAKGISIDDMKKTSELLVKSGASIKEINVVRKHLSSVKGGLLAKTAFPAKTHSLIVSDVIGNYKSVIASGPTAPDKSTFSEAHKIMKKYSLLEKVPSRVRKRILEGRKRKISETPNQKDKTLSKSTHKIIADNKKVIDVMAKKAGEMGYRVLIYGKPLKGEAKNAAKKLINIAEKRKDSIALLAGGETTVTVMGNGKGGRNQEFVLGALNQLAENNRMVLASLATDGKDGTSFAAGAIANTSTLNNAKSKKLEPENFLSKNNSAAFFSKMGLQIITGPTDTNLIDISIVLKW